MASHGDISQGNQIFLAVRTGSSWPPKVVDIRVHYEQTIGDLKQLACQKLGLPADKLQLFHKKKELTAAYDGRTLTEMSMHTGFSLQGWDLTETPEYWPPVIQTPEGLVLDC